MVMISQKNHDLPMNECKRENFEALTRMLLFFFLGELL